MTSEQNVPEVPSHQGPAISQSNDQQDGNVQFSGQPAQHGMGQSKSSRRRRRKRKNKTASDGQGQQGGAPQAGDQPVGQIQAAAQPQGQQHNQDQHGQNAGGKRWKKKFRDRDRPRGGGDNQGNGFRSHDTHQPGNVVSGYKRKGGKQQQQRGSRGFVGPMDHSYRAVNGNFADAPPSTIDGMNGNYQGRSGGRGGYQGDSQPIDYSQGRAIPIPEGAPTKIYFFIEDLFITAKIQETARKLGVKVAFVKNDKDVVAGLIGAEEDDRAGLIVFDLNNANAKPLTLIPKLKAKLKRSTSIIGFLSHLQGDLKAKAVEAGCDTVMPRAAFSQNLPNLLRRYGFEEEEETNFNQ
ncbi:hypothetical protein GCM10011507_27050 [Edaphobacter acidisoli]|uniref:Response regulator n=1 Tax=Edaphobacter acidisoli TaxID=2040573 RepID=A0A916RYX0_9BACT|nr:response regulator [Edaphobacter acidisoli]GGA74270.1 hypothetical protein GCM10011507_27050 [Edaphobacter acidisoli]